MEKVISNKFRAKTGVELRKFGFIMAFMLALIAGFSIWKHGEITRLAIVLLSLALIFMVLAVIKPLLLTQVEKYWIRLGEKLGAVMTVVILALIYYLIVTPVGCIARLIGEDLLKLKIDKKAETYWITRERTAARYYKPY